MSNPLTIKHQDISGSEFEDLNMANSRFTNINLRGAHYHDINFSDVMFTAAMIGGTTFKHIGPHPAPDGTQPRQQPVTFEEGMLCDSTFRDMDMSGVKIIDCNLDGMTIDGVPVADMLRLWNSRKT